jgi:DNA modification methylase
VIDIRSGDCLSVMASMDENSVDAIVTDPPYHLASIVKRFGAEDAAPAESNGAPRVSASALRLVGPGRFLPYKRASAGFMGKKWDGGDIAFDPATWAAAFRVLKPGGHMVAFGAPKNAHRLTCAIEDAGFEIRDVLMWVFGTGFPKSLDVSKAIDKAAGVDREDKFEGSFDRRAGPTGNKRCEKCGKWLVSGSPCQCPRPQDAPQTPDAQRWEGWGTALKPAYEPIVLARKPLIGTVAENVLRYGTGAINIDACRVEGGERVSPTGGMGRKANPIYGTFANTEIKEIVTSLGRWPANLVHDGSDEVLAAFPETAPSKSGKPRASKVPGDGWGMTSTGAEYDDSGSAARFFYCAKAGKADRAGSKHPTVKPIALMRWLCRLITPPGGTIFDPFAGTGTTGAAAEAEGFNAILVEREAEYIADIRRRFDVVFDLEAELG